MVVSQFESWSQLGPYRQKERRYGGNAAEPFTACGGRGLDPTGPVRLKCAVTSVARRGVYGVVRRNHGLGCKAYLQEQKAPTFLENVKVLPQAIDFRTLTIRGPPHAFSRDAQLAA